MNFLIGLAAVFSVDFWPWRAGKNGPLMVAILKIGQHKAHGQAGWR